MPMSFLHPKVSEQTEAVPASRQPGLGQMQADVGRRIDWRAARRAQRACCCTARPAVIAVIPPSEDRPHQTDLLLCGHHYRASSRALAAAKATVLNIDGSPVTDSAWRY
ncbi:MAG: hypothetical protein ACLPN6_20580 [Streptosporangiaceae bacterium]|jgi:hypothetical protein